MKLKKYLNYIFIIILIIISFNKQDFNLIYKTKNFQLKIHYIDVGQGDCILVQSNDKNLLIDSGPTESKKKLLSYLKKLNISRIDYLIATHPHEDHIGNIYTLIKYYNVKSFYSPKVKSSSYTFEKIIEALIDKQLKIKVLHNNTNSIDLGENINFSIFCSPNVEDNLNSYSPIIKITYGKNSFLFTGDAEYSNESYLMNIKADLKSTVLKVGHHGSNTSTSNEFLDYVNPKIAIISVGLNNSYDHPNKNTLNKLIKKKCKILRTDINGTIILTSDGKNIKYERYNQN